MKRFLAISIAGGLVGCGGGGPQAAEKPKPAPAAVISNGGIKEGELATIKLTAESEKRLGIETASAAFRRVRRTRSYAGDCVLPPGQSVTVAAPVGGTLIVSHVKAGANVAQGDPLFRLLPLAAVQRDLRVTAEGDRAAARARLEGAQLRLKRAVQLLRDEVGSVRQKELAEEEVRVAEAALGATEARLKQIENAPLDADTPVEIRAPSAGIVRQLLAQPGQMVPGGTPLVEIAQLGALWIRVPVYAGESRELDASAAAEVYPLNGAGGRPLFTAQPVPAPPTADPIASSVDLYYAAASSQMRPGERVTVNVPLRGAEEGLTIPWSAVLYDVHGGAWAYQRTAPLTYTRRRIEPLRVSGGMMLLARGLETGAEVVTAGAAELFGIEFGPGK